MTRRVSLTALGLVGIALLTAAVVVLVAAYPVGEDGSEPPVGTLPTVTEPGSVPPPVEDDTEVSAPPPEIATRTTLAPRTVLFGDTVRATVDVVVDTEKIDPASVKVAAAFTPWEMVGRPTGTRSDAGSLAHLRTSYDIRCVKSTCLSIGQATQLEFVPARVGFIRRGPAASDDRVVERVAWPVLTVYSRLATANFEGRAGLITPWRVELTDLPAVTQRSSPNLLLAILLAAGALFAVLGGVLVYLAWPRAVREPEPEPEPEPPPVPRLTPLQQALVLLEDAARSDGAEDRRRSLELVAEALEEWGDEDLARAARNLAWSELPPLVEDTSRLATRVRETLEIEEEAEREALEGDLVHAG